MLILVNICEIVKMYYVALYLEVQKQTKIYFIFTSFPHFDVLS